MTEKSNNKDLLDSHHRHRIRPCCEQQRRRRGSAAADQSGLFIAGRESARRRPPTARPQPAVPIKRSVHPDYFVCLEDGKKLKMLKRHLMTSYKLTPEAIANAGVCRPDYPMVAPNYAKQRSRLAKEIGLGTRGRKDAASIIKFFS